MVVGGTRTLKSYGINLTERLDKNIFLCNDNCKLFYNSSQAKRGGSVVSPKETLVEWTRRASAPFTGPRYMALTPRLHGRVS